METQFADKFNRLLHVWDQLSHDGQLKGVVGKIATSTRSCAGNLDAIVNYAQSMQATYKPDSQGWAVLGCCMNILRGTRPVLAVTTSSN